MVTMSEYISSTNNLSRLAQPMLSFETLAGAKQLSIVTQQAARTAALIAEPVRIATETIKKQQDQLLRTLSQASILGNQINEIMNSVNKSMISSIKNAQYISALEFPTITDLALENPDDDVPQTESLEVLSAPQNKHWKRLLWNDQGSFKSWAFSILMLLRNQLDTLLVRIIIVVIISPAAIGLLKWLGLLHLFRNIFQ